MAYKYDFEDRHIERLVWFVHRGLDSQVKEKLNFFIKTLPKTENLVHESYLKKRNEVIDNIESSNHDRYRSMDIIFNDRQKLVASFSFFVKEEAYRYVFDDIGDCFEHCQKKLTQELLHYQFLNLLDDWYDKKLSKTKDEPLPIQDEELNYNKLTPDFEIEKLAKYFQNNKEYAYLVLNILYDNNFLDKNCKWIPEIDQEIGAIRGIVRYFETMNLTTRGVPIRRVLFPKVRKLLYAGEKYCNPDSKLSPRFEKLTEKRLQFSTNL